MNYLLLINPVLILACALVALVCLRHKPFDWWYLFIPFLLVTTLVEWVGYYQGMIPDYSNHWWYNLYMPVDVTFVFFILQRACAPYYNITRWLVPVWMVFLVMYGVESYQSGFEGYSTYASTFASIATIPFALCYFYFLMKEETYVDLLKHPPFLMVSGLLVYYFGAIVLAMFMQQLTEIYLSTGLPVRNIISLVLNFILYSSWSYAFICRYQQRSSLSLSS